LDQQLADLESQRNLLKGQIGEQTKAAIDATKENAHVRQMQLVRDENQRTFDSFKRQAEGVFDALATKSKSVFGAIGDAFKTAMLTAIKEIVTSNVARMMMQIFGGQRGGSSAYAGAGGNGGGGGLSGILGGMLPMFGGGGGLEAASASADSEFPAWADPEGGSQRLHSFPAAAVPARAEVEGLASATSRAWAAAGRSFSDSARPAVRSFRALSRPDLDLRATWPSSARATQP
jgi:hypothetical protein